MHKKVAILSFLLSSLLYGENVVKLNETVISTENFETKVRDTPANVSIVTAEEIQNTGATTLVDALRNVPGLYAREYQNGEVRFDLRGQNAMYANKNVIVTVDGVPLNSVGRGSADSYMLSQIPIETIERIEVIPNGGGVMYGNGAVGGMVNIITKSSKSQVSYGHLSAKAGSHDLFNEHVSYGTMLGDKLLTEVSVTQHNNKTFREEEKIDRFNTRFLGKYFLDDGEAEFKYNYSKGKTRIAGGTVTYYQPFDTKKRASRKKYDYQDFYGKYRKNITENIELLVYGNYVHNDTSPYSNRYKKYYTNELKERKNYIKTQLKYSYLPESYFIVGSDFMKHSEEDSSQRNFKMSSDAKATNEMNGLYFINKFTYGKFQFTQGVRRDRNKYNFYYKKLTNVIPKEKWYTRDNKKFENTSFELAANYLYSDTGSTYINYNKTFRAPTAYEIGTFEGEPTVETANTIEVGWKEFIGNSYLNTSIFYTNANNYLYSKIPSVPEEWEKSITENLGRVKKYGVEFFGEHYIDKLTIRTGLTYIHHKIKKSGVMHNKNIPSVPNWKITLGGTYQFNEKFSIGADALYHGSMYVLDYLKYLDSSKMPSKGNESDLSKYDPKVKNYITVDLFSNYKITDSLSVTGRINNLFDKKYGKYVGAWGDYSGDPTYVVQQIYPAAGRTYTIELNYKF